MRKPTSFVVLFPGRSGGTWLFSIIAGSAFARVHEEALRNSFDRITLNKWGKDAATHFQKALMWNFMRPSFYTKATTFGFITRFGHVRNLLDLQFLLKQYNAKIISLTRDNRVKHALSFVSGHDLHRRTGLFHIIPDNPDSGLPMKSFLPDPDELYDKVVWLEKWVTEQKAFVTHCVNHLGVEALHLTYEEMQANVSGIAQKVYEFLDLPDVEGAAMDLLQKNMDDDLRKALPNYGVVRERFRETEFEYYFPD